MPRAPETDRSAGDGPVVAIDGPAGAGKSSLARRLAVALGLPYVNTGVMYRAVAREALRTGTDTEDEAALAGLARDIRFEIEDRGTPPGLVVDGEPPGEDLVTPDVEGAVSAVSRHPDVRAVLRAEQRRLGSGGAVVEGRDIGSVVFPDAAVKIFLDADPSERAARRQAERRRSDPELASALARRDELDARVNPFVPAKDAVAVDTSGRTEEEVYEEALRVIRAALDGGPGEGSATPRRLPRVAIVGRQNVGKSSLLNRLLGAREAIAHETPGVTRDRVEARVTWRGRTFIAVDTGGYVRRAKGIEALVGRQVDVAVAEADLILLVVDAVTGVQEEDADLARRLQKAPVPVVLVGNKVDSAAQEPGVGELYRLGLGDPVPVSALHGRGSGELLDRMVTLLPSEPQGEPLVEGEITLAIIGRPNVGKSSLFNRLVGTQRAVVSEESGTTRDAVDSIVDWDGKVIRFVDTAGFRKPSRAEGVQYYGFVRAVRAIDRSHVACLVVDAEEGVTTEDRKIAARVGEAGRGLVVVANKWDLVEDREARLRDIKERVAVFPGVPVLRTSALTGAGTGRVVPSLLEVHGNWARRISTGDVNRVLQAAQGETPPPRVAGRLLYGTQVATGPPRFVIFMGGTVPAAYRRFLENRLRDVFGFGGVPIRLSFRKRQRRRKR